MLISDARSLTLCQTDSKKESDKKKNGALDLFSAGDPDTADGSHDVLYLWGLSHHQTSS